MRGMTKRFPGVLANDRVDFSLSSGEVHALLGENGAGKSTLMNMLYGLYTADSGEIRFRGRSVRISSPKDAIALGITMVHQQFELVDTLTVTENVSLGLHAEREPLLDLRGTAKKVSKLSQSYGLRVNPSSLIRELSVGEKQKVEILKALSRGTQVLILDEPTSVLTPQESEELFRFIRAMTKEGKSVVFITHKLHEVMEVSDTITVLRKGRVVGRVATKSTTPAQLAVMMVGRDVVFPPHTPTGPMEGALLSVDSVHALGDKGSEALRGLSMEVAAGEILGLAGVAGNGQNELVDVLSGTRKASSGSIKLKGVDVTNHSPREVIGEGIGVIPEDRRGAGLIMEFSIAENLVLERRGSEPFSRQGLLNQKDIRSHAESLVKEFSISTPDVSAPAYTLSGGNLQRLLLAKVLSRKPSVLVAAQPTAGLDVGATEFIWEKLRSEKESGVGILLISSDLNEIVTLSDRIACIYEGAIVGTMASGAGSVEKIGLLMGGAKTS